MKSGTYLIAIALASVLLFPACGPSEEEQAVTTTRIEADEFASQAAGKNSGDPVCFDYWPIKQSEVAA
jgi:hypothetical protein